MSNFTAVTVTDAGRQLINSAIGAGQTVQIVNCEVGSGYPDGSQEPESFTGLLQFKMFATETSSNDLVTYQTTVRLRVSSALAPSSFQINEVGIYAQVGIASPILFAYAATQGDGDTITPDPGPNPAVYDYAFLIEYEGDAPVQAAVDMTEQVQLHAITHRGLGIDPIPLADATDTGLLTKPPGDATKVLLGTIPQTFGPIPVHAPTHLDNGTDPIPVATTARTGLLTKVPGDATKVLLGTNPQSFGPIPLHAPTHLDNGTDPIPVATTARTGLLRQLSGQLTDSLRGDGTWGFQGLPPSSMIDYAGSVAPAGWLICDGASYPTATYPALFAAIGYTYGGSGANFNVPNCRNRVTIGVGPSYPLGVTGGEVSHILAQGEMPSHQHQQWARSQDTVDGSGYAIGGPYEGEGNDTSFELTGWSGGVDAQGHPIDGPNVGFHPGAKGTTAPHNNMQPYVVVNKIIKI
jgi:microcystin-dependent protein